MIRSYSHCYHFRVTASAVLQPFGGRSVPVRNPAALGLIPFPSVSFRLAVRAGCSSGMSHAQTPDMA